MLTGDVKKKKKRKKKMQQQQQQNKTQPTLPTLTKPPAARQCATKGAQPYGLCAVCSGTVLQPSQGGEPPSQFHVASAYATSALMSPYSVTLLCASCTLNGARWALWADATATRTAPRRNTAVITVQPLENGYPKKCVFMKTAPDTRFILHE